MKELFEAMKTGDSAEAGRLLDAHPEAVDARNENNLPAVLVAMYYGRPELARLLLAKGARTDIFSACANGLTPRIAELIDADRSLIEAHSSDGWTPLHLASFFGHLDAAALLIEHGARLHTLSINAMRNTPLHAAAARSHTEVAELLLSKGADVNAKQEGGWTPLHAAAANGNAKLAASLLAYGAEPFEPAQNNQTPLDMALTKGHAEVVRLLESRDRPE